MRITANQVTIARICALPFIGYTVYGDPRLQVLGVIIGTFVGLTDFVDGYLARKYGSTVLGSLLDPVADKVFVIVCYACYADRGFMPWWVAAAILSRELLVTVLRSSLELRGRRLPSTIVAKVKTWVQMIGFGLLTLVHVLGSGRGLVLLFAVPLAVAVLVASIGHLVAPVLFRPFGFAAVVLAAFLLAATGGQRAAEIAVLGLVVSITWYSALDYLGAGWRELTRKEPHRALHLARLIAGAGLPVIALAAIATPGLPTIPIVLLLSTDMARGALDNYAAHLGMTDFSWGASLWAEIALLVAAMVSPPAAGFLTVVAAVVSGIETLRAFARYLRAPATRTEPRRPAVAAATSTPAER